MSSIAKVTDSTIGGDVQRTTIEFTDHTTRDIDYTRDGLIITDHTPDGKSVSGPGVVSILGSGGFARLKV